MGQVELWWLPVGAGGRVVVRTSRWWEGRRARREGRSPRGLFHAALEIQDRAERYVVEMTPAWGNRGAERGVVATGPVGARVLGRSPLFRYEVRCWRDGVIPDLAYAVGPPRVFGRVDTGRLRERVGEVPRYTWGRDVLGVGDMWNSNSLVAWLLQGEGIDAAAVRPPAGGDAPGWATGIAVAHRR